MSRSRQRQDSEEICYDCGQLRKLAKLRPSKGVSGEDTFVCKNHKACGKEERIIIKALVRRTVKNEDGKIVNDRQLQWTFKEIGNDQIEMSGPLLPINSPTLQDIRKLVDTRRLQFKEGPNKITLLCLNFTRDIIMVTPESVEIPFNKPFLVAVK